MNDMTSSHAPNRMKIVGRMFSQLPIKFAAYASMATTAIMNKAPIESSCRLLSDITLPAYVIVAPHSGQNFEPAGIE